MKKFWRKKMFSLKSMTKLEDLTVPFHTAGKGELGISLSLTLTALALAGKFAHTCLFLNHALTKCHD
jgi:hypothetical protein